MLKTRVIPTLLWKDYGLVKGVAFDSWRRIGTVLPALKVYNTRQVDELILVDISATRDRRVPYYGEIENLAAECFVPLTVGGGVCHIDHIKDLLRAGADKVGVNSALYSDLKLLSQAAEKFGSQCMVASIDAKKHADGRYECFSHSGTLATGREVSQWAKELEKNGAGEILLTSIDRDGTLSGYDLDLIKMVAESVKIPVIASGGASKAEDFYQALHTAKASAVAAASLFHFTQHTPLEVKKYLYEKGIPVRLMHGTQSFAEHLHLGTKG